MTTLKNLKGTAIQFLDADPVVYVGTWSSGGSMNTARDSVGSSSAGTQTASIAFGGVPPPTATAINESYNGSSWTEVNDMNTAKRGPSGLGTSTAALSAGGDVGAAPFLNAVETWNGSSWTETTEINTARSYAFAFGIQTAGVIAGGYIPPSYGTTAVTEYWNGSSWTETGDLNTARFGIGGAGVYTAGLVSGNPSGNTETFNGSSWTEVADLNTGRGENANTGSQTAALTFGGSPNGVTLTESWDGSSWTEVNDMATARRYGGGSGSSTSALSFAGKNPGGETNATEEWSFPPITATILQEGQMWFNSSSSTLKGYGTAAGIPAATWSTGGSLNQTTKNSIQGAGTQTAALSAGGSSGDPAADTKLVTAEEYNGTSWTEVNDLNSAKFVCTTTGTQTAAILFGGSPAVAETEHYNGSTWTEVADLNTGRYEIAAAGGYTAGLAFTGRTPGTTYNAINESWNGTSWTETTDLNTARRGAYGSGSQADAVGGGKDHSSVAVCTAPGDVDPPKANADVLLPFVLPPSSRLPVPKSFTSVHTVPFQLSVLVTAVERPPKAKLFVLEDPDPANKSLAVFKSLTSVQEEPFQSSVAPVAPGVVPPAITAAVVDPDPIPLDLAVLIAVELVKLEPL